MNKSFLNIEKSAFRPGQYVGYSGRGVYRITKSTSSSGNWWAQNQIDPADQFWTFGLAAMSAALDARGVQS